ncbi:MAG: lysophospholipid acyltransferase family protein [Pseudomonadota bacterium]
MSHYADDSDPMLLERPEPPINRAPERRSRREKAKAALKRLRERVRLKFPELTYASPEDPWARRLTVRTVEHIAGRNYFVKPYEKWIRDHIALGKPIIRPMLGLIDIDFDVKGQWPPKGLDADAPLVIVANHPYGVLDGIGALRLAEELDRPFKVLIHKDLMKVREIRDYCLPIDFEPTREAQASNIKVRNEALRLLKAGTTIVVFPAGGVATAPAPWGFGDAVELPWKTFTARMILAARAQVVPMYFEGQCSRMFQVVSQSGQTLRTALLIHELRRRVGSTLKGRIGDAIPFEELKEASGGDRKAVVDYLFDKVHAQADRPVAKIKADQDRLAVWLKA